MNELEYEGRTRLPRGASLRDHGTTLLTRGYDGRFGGKGQGFRGGQGGCADLGKESKNGYTARDWAQLEKKGDVKTYLKTVMRQRGIEIRELVEEGRRRRSSRRSSSRSRTKRRREQNRNWSNSTKLSHRRICSGISTSIKPSMSLTVIHITPIHPRSSRQQFKQNHLNSQCHLRPSHYSNRYLAIRYHLARI